MTILVIKGINAMQILIKLKELQKAHIFTIYLYKTSSTFFSEEQFELTNQILRASVSIKSNLAEDARRSIREAWRKPYFRACTPLNCNYHAFKVSHGGNQ